MKKIIEIIGEIKFLLFWFLLIVPLVLIYCLLAVIWIVIKNPMKAKRRLKDFFYEEKVVHWEKINWGKIH